MLLFELNKEESRAFMRLVSEFVTVDKKINKEEKSVIEKYLNKLNMNKEEINEISHTEAIEILDKSEDKIKNMVYFELLGVALIDGDYETSEVDYLEEVADKFNISRATKIALANYYFDVDKMKNKSEEEVKEKLIKILN
ncbi:hypothetical protein H8S10_00740 [Clostridium sp. NSJ-49]|uniref:Tellurite resistance protein n=1 Tax=Clostridium disporicum TaxID=84024 RepID=A0A174GL81_9CLOT|nr:MULTISPECIES: hypothetical protein [Clostridium]MBC5623985.1 hypothetical protein [Clostridium sp. NSJ-49]MCD2502948.1 hypothetical protein [Clostridium sp. NSJ-145]CUO63113.1 Tellurite resistance protein [Clostridium disporicum]